MCKIGVGLIPFGATLPLWKSLLNVSVWVLEKGTSIFQVPEHGEPFAFSKETTDVRVLVWMQGITKNCRLLCCEIRKCLAPCSHASTRDSKYFRWWRTWGHKTYEYVGRCTLCSSTSWVLLWVVNFATPWDLQWLPFNLNSLKAICHSVLSVYPSCMHSGRQLHLLHYRKFKMTSTLCSLYPFSSFSCCMEYRSVCKIVYFKNHTLSLYGKFFYFQTWVKINRACKNSNLFSKIIYWRQESGLQVLHFKFFWLYEDLNGFGGLEVACWPLVPKFTGSNPAEAVGFLRAKKSSARLPPEEK
jgi:hypothetical protein